MTEEYGNSNDQNQGLAPVPHLNQADSGDCPDLVPAERAGGGNFADTDHTKHPEFIEPANIKNFFWRIPELWTDPTCNQLSASRFVLFLMGLLTVFVSVWMTVNGRGSDITTMIAAVTATVAGIYFASTVKDWRWRGRKDRTPPDLEPR